MNGTSLLYVINSIRNKQLGMLRNTEEDVPQCNARNVSKTIAAYAAFFAVGVVGAILGSTLLHLCHRTHTSVESIALLFTWRAIGCLLGNSIGAAIFNKVKPEVILAGACFCLGVANMAVPWCEKYYALSIVFALQGVSTGILGGGCNGYIVKTWRMRSPPFLQALHFMLSFGSALTPKVVDLFVENDLRQMRHFANVSSAPVNNQEANLSEVFPLFDMHENDGRNYSSMDKFNTVLQPHTERYENFASGITPHTDWSENLTSDKIPYKDKDRYEDFLSGDTTSDALFLNVFWELFYSYTIAGVVIFLTFICFIFNLFLERTASPQTEKCQEKHTTDEMKSLTDRTRTNNNQIKQHKLQRIVLIGLIMTFCMFYGGLECTYGGFILTFAVEYLHVSFATASLISTVFWGSHAFGRALSIIAAKYCSPDKSIAFCLVTGLVAFIVISLACKIHISISFICSVFVGCSFAPIFGNTISYAQRMIPVSGRETSLFVIGLYFGFISFPSLVGYLFTNYSAIMFLYTCTVATLVACVLFTCIVLYERIILVKTIPLQVEGINSRIETMKAIDVLSSQSSLC